MVVNPGAYAIVGMAAVFAGAARAPITAILIVFEMSGDYKLILPLMLATVLSTIVAELMFSDSIYSLKLKIKGVNIHRGRDEAVLKSVLVQDVMRPITHPIRETTTIPQLLTIFSRTHLHGLPILDETGGLYGLVTLHDVEEIRQDSLEQQTVAEVATLYDDLVFAYPDDTVDLVLRQLSARELGHMPIVARANPKELLGFIRREDILKAYEIALVKRQAWRKDADGGQLQHQPDMNLIDVIVTAHCRTVGLTVQEIAPLLPEKCVLVSIQRDERVVVPHGDTVLQMDDTLTIYVNKEDMEQTKALFTKKVVEERQPTEQ
jgi:CIC family chloride channel protein